MDLLLGDSSWILETGRDNLLKKIRHLSDLNVDGLNLDLEPNQLTDDSKIDEHLLRSLATTLKEAKEVAPWPVSLTIRPRYTLSNEFLSKKHSRRDSSSKDLLDQELQTYDLGKELETIRLNEVIAMI